MREGSVLSRCIKIINLITNLSFAEGGGGTNVNGILKTYLQRLRREAYQQILDFSVKGANGSE